MGSVGSYTDVHSSNISSSFSDGGAIRSATKSDDDDFGEFKLHQGDINESRGDDDQSRIGVDDESRIGSAVDSEITKVTTDKNLISMQAINSEQNTMHSKKRRTDIEMMHEKH